MNLIKQIFKFGIVGVICFIFEYIMYRLFKSFMSLYIALVISFTLSTILNYLLSLKFVFDSKRTNKKKEFIVFVILSIGGLLLNEICMYLGVEIIYAYIANFISKSFAENYSFKFITTGIVMVYNFITRKLFLEKED